MMTTEERQMQPGDEIIKSLSEVIKKKFNPFGELPQILYPFDR